MTKPCRLVAKRGLNAQKTGKYFAVQLIGYSGQNPPPEPPDPHLNKKDDPAYIIEWTDSTDNRSSGYDGFEWWGDVNGSVGGDGDTPFRFCFAVFNPWMGWPTARVNTKCLLQQCFEEDQSPDGERYDWSDFGTPTFAVGDSWTFKVQGYDGLNYYNRIERLEDTDNKEFVIWIDD